MTDELKQAMHFLKIEQELRIEAERKLEEAQARNKVLEDALRFYAQKKVITEHGFGISQRIDDGTIAQKALSTTSSVQGE